MEFHFEKDDAIKYGINQAILLYNLKFWIRKNKANKQNFYNGHYWTYNSCEAFVELFPFWNRKQISRLLIDLEQKGAILSGNYNENRYDRTKWYALTDDSLLDQTSGNDIPNDCQKITNRLDKNDQSIYTYNKPYNKPYNNIEEKENKFKKPTIEEIKNYCNEINVSLNAENFFDYYESKGWLIGKSKMKDWKASVRTWARNSNQIIGKPKKETFKPKPIKQETDEEFNKRLQQMKESLFKA